MNQAETRKQQAQGKGLRSYILHEVNGNRPHGHGPIDPAHFSPYPKNPIIARVFKEIGFADELGSGVRKLFKYCKAYGGHDPELVENDIFNVLISLPVDPVKTSVKTSVKIVAMMKDDKKISAVAIAEKLGLSLRAVELQLAKLKEENKIKRIGPAKGGHWEVTE